MATITGDRWIVDPYHSVAATATDTAYYPMGRNLAVAAAMDGPQRNVLIKEIRIGDNSSGNVSLNAIIAIFRDGTTFNLIGGAGIDVTRTGSIDDMDGYHLLCNTKLENLSHIQIITTNVHATNAYYVASWIRYEPLG